MKKCAYCEFLFKPNRNQKTCSEICRIKSCIKINHSCWEWQGALSKSGYGKITFTSGTKRAHRYSFEVFKGNIPEGMWVLHNCPNGDNKKCVNPDHLWLGTNKDNCEDFLQKGGSKKNCGKPWSNETRLKMKERKHAIQTGEKNNAGKLTEEDVRNIKNLIKNGLGNKEIGLMYRVSPACIYQIRQEKNWSHIE